MEKIDVYDFDGTIYQGDTSKDFLKYAIKKDKKIIKYIPKITYYLILAKLKVISTKKFKEKYFSFIKDIKNQEEMVDNFWEENEKKINKKIIEKMNENNYIISASPEFLLKPYTSKLKNVKLIATKMNRDGTIIGENCKGEEKVKRLQEEILVEHQKDNNTTKAYNNDKDKDEIIIENFYTDSLVDMPLVNKAKKSYYVTKNEIEEFNLEKIKDRKSTKISKWIFLLFVIIYIVLGVNIASYDYNINEDILFESDNSRVISDMTEIFESHYRLSVHPLFVILTEPIYFIISGITQNKILALIIMSSIVSALSVAIMQKIFSIFSKNNKLNVLLTICYGLTFSNIIFTAGIEVYNYATLGLITFWYFIIKKIKSSDGTITKPIDWKKKIDWKLSIDVKKILKENCKNTDFLILVTLGIIAISITITNYIVFLIGCMTLILAKSEKRIKIVLANITVIIVCIGLSIFQNVIWQNTPLITQVLKTPSEESIYINTKITPKKIENVISGCYANSIIATDVRLEKVLKFNQRDKYNNIALGIFYITIAIFTIKNIKKNPQINIGIILTLLFNSCLHLVYGNGNSFLYSMHFTYLIFLLFGINCLGNRRRKN